MSDLGVLSVVCPTCKGRKAKQVEPGDRFDPPQHDTCPEPERGGCGGLGVVPSEALDEAVRGPETRGQAAFAVLRLIEEA